MIRLTPDPAAPQVLVGFSQETSVPAQRPDWSLLSPAGHLRDSPPGGPVVVWTGSMAQKEERRLFDSDPRTWGPRGWEALEAGCEQAVGWPSALYLIRPHARHVVSDVPGIRHFGNTIAAKHPGRFALLLDPASMLDTRHLEQSSAADTLRRIAEEIPTLGSRSFPVMGVVIANVRREGDRLALTGIDEGEVDAALIRRLFG